MKRVYFYNMFNKRFKFDNKLFWFDIKLISLFVNYFVYIAR